MKHFLLEEPPDSDGLVLLRGKDYHYLVRVRRLGTGSVFNAMLPDGTKVKLNILSVENETITAQSIYNDSHARQTPALSTETFYTRLVLFQALPKFSKMNIIVRQATEAGVAVIVPFLSEYSTVKMNTFAMDAAPEKFRRWQRIIKEACQQSGSTVKTEIMQPRSIDEVLEYWKKLCSEQGNTKGIFLHQEGLAEGNFHGYLCNNPSQVVLVTGPEGGFSGDEAARFIEAGFKPLLLGTNILRTETAALFGIAAVRIILMESKTWAPID